MKLKEYMEIYGEYDVTDEDKLVNSLERVPETIWELEGGDKYWVLYEDGSVSYSRWADNMTDIAIRMQGNAFLTEEEARYEKRRREVCALVKRRACKFDINKTQYQPYLDFADKSIGAVELVYFKEHGLCFESKEEIQAAINEVGEDDFIKYYLGEER